MAIQTTWQKAGLIHNEWIAHLVRKAAYRRELAQFQAGVGNVTAARQLTQDAVARELYTAGQRGEVTRAETQVVDALLPTWTGSSSEELLATARDILSGRPAGS